MSSIHLPVPPRQLRDHLLGHGRQVVSLDEVAVLTGLGRRAAADAMTRLRRGGQFFAPASGLYVAVPPQYSTWGVVPATDFIDAMMRTLSRGYYVGLLSAAELHGAAHQLPQVFQVMVDRPVRDRDLARVRLRFYTRTRLREVPVQLRNTATGQLRLATPEATALDLASRPNDAGGLNNVATVVAELAQEAKLNTAALSVAAEIYPLAAVRRLGWLLERVGDDADTAELADALETLVHRAVPERRRAADLLDPAGARRGVGSARWGLVENVVVEPDL